jgi:hypothetical protein
MHFLMCKHRVADFDLWKKTLRAHAEMHAAAGLRVRKIWRSVEDARAVFFLFEVTDLEKVKAFLAQLNAQRDSDASKAADYPDMYLVSKSPV